MLAIYSIILIFLILIFCGEKGAKSIVVTAGNSLIMLIAIFLIYWGYNPVIVTFILSILSSSFILFYQNEMSKRTQNSFFATMIVLIILIPFIFYITKNGVISGFNNEQYEITDSNGYSRNVGISMISLEISTMIIALLGAVLDVSVAITSAMAETYRQHPYLSKLEIVISGINIGKSVLSTSIHTIFYIYMAEYFTLILQFLNYSSFARVINSKAFAQGVISITITGIGCCLVVPIAILITVSRKEID